MLATNSHSFQYTVEEEGTGKVVQQCFKTGEEGSGTKTGEEGSGTKTGEEGSGTKLLCQVRPEVERNIFSIQRLFSYLK